MKRNHVKSFISPWKLLEGKRGTTLAELCVVMLLLAILGTMTVGFCVSASQVSAKEIDNTMSISDETQVRKFLDKWLSIFDTEVYFIGAEDTNGDKKIDLFAQKLTDVADDSSGGKRLDKSKAFYVVTVEKHIIKSNLPEDVKTSTGLENLSVYTESVTAINCERVVRKADIISGTFTDTTEPGIEIKEANDGARLYFSVTCQVVDTEPTSFVIVKGANLYSRCAGKTASQSGGAS